VRRASGLLLHLTSLPGRFGIGDLGIEARRFVDFLAAAGQRWWQLLPINPTGYGDSPYSAFSAFAGNPLLISPDELALAGDLAGDELTNWRLAPSQTDYGHAWRCRRQLLPRAAKRFFSRAQPPRQEAFDAFCAEQAFWLNDYALFQALREHFGNRPWTSWPEPIRDRQQEALREWGERLAGRILELKYEQFVFFEQWQGLKVHAARQGIGLFGDMPIFVALDSADVWCNRQLFRLDEQGQPTVVAGVPPDYFSARGQRWGNPLYDWPAHQAQDFSWWKARLRWNLQLFELLRIDHFRGFAACWVIPADCEDATGGAWDQVPGDRLFHSLSDELGVLPLVAEDLGIITDEVTALKERWGWPGMKVLQFAFDSGPDNPYLPHNHCEDCVVYTGTHDNDTTLGWWRTLTPEVKERVRSYLMRSCRDMPRELVREAMASVARLCILPVQDILALPSTARMNRPGAANGNWTWRLPKDALSTELAAELRQLTERYGRRN